MKSEDHPLKNAHVVTVQKFNNFSVTQILREINFGEYRSSKTAILGALKLVNVINILLKVQKFKFSQSVTTASSETPDLPNLISHKI